MGAVLTLTAFVASWYFGRRSLGAGMTVVLAAGYFYGIARAQFHDVFTMFIFDLALLGLYLTRFTLPGALAPPHAKALTTWVRVLIGWPFVMLLLCALFPRHPLLQVAGLRSSVWFLPALLLGASARAEDLTAVARALAVLNLVSLVFAGGEYFLGVERFYPKSDVTALIYKCNDAGGALRIPATFIHSTAYGGTMVATIPLLVGRWLTPTIAVLERWLFALALLAAMLGTFVCGSRLPVVMLFALGAILVYHLRTRLGYMVLALGLALFVGYVVSGSGRLQRFTTLQDTDLVQSRLQTSVNLGVLDLVLEYPLGAGLGSAFGTTVPSFLVHLVDRQQIGAENEYARIGVEQGLVGLAIWMGFLIWFFVHPRVDPYPGWNLTCKLMLTYIFVCWGSASIGAGMLAAIPSTVLLLFQMGVISRDRMLSVRVRQPNHLDDDWALRHRDSRAIPQRSDKPCPYPG